MAKKIDVGTNGNREYFVIKVRIVCVSWYEVVAGQSQVAVE